MRFFDSTVGRIGTAVATGGASEVYRKVSGSSLADTVGGALGLTKGKGEDINDPYAADKADLIAKLKIRAEGGEPSLAEAQTKKNMSDVLNNQVSAIRSAPGLNPALQARLASQAGQQVATDTAQQGAIAKLAEQDAAYGQLANTINGASAQEISRQQAEGAAENARIGRFGQVASGVGTAIAASDKNAKENIQDSNGAGRELIDHLKGKLYDYKDTGANGEGEHIGILAQDLEKSPLGKSMVFEDNGTKKVDFGKGFGAVLAAVTEINEKLKELESKGKK